MMAHFPSTLIEPRLSQEVVGVIPEEG